MLASVKKIKANMEARYIADMKKRGVDGAAVLKYYYGEVAKLQKQ